MPYTQADVDEAKRRLAETGDVKSNSFGDRSVTSVDIADRLRMIAIMQAEVDAATSTPRPKQRLAYHAGKGL